MRRNPFVYYGKKLLVFLLSVVILSVAVFYISRLAPGDPLMSYYGERVEKMSVEEKEAARDKLGLNDPIHIQYIRWVENAAKGDFGISFKYKQDVMEVIGSRIGFTLILGGIGFVLTFVLFSNLVVFFFYIFSRCFNLFSLCNCFQCQRNFNLLCSVFFKLFFK